MADILVRGLDAQVLRRLKVRARSNGRSLQSEAKLLLERAAGLSMGEALKLAGRRRRQLVKRFDDSAALIRQDRRR